MPAGSGPADVALVSGGTERRYRLDVPGSYDGAPLPLVIDLHGYLSGADGQRAMSGLGTFGDQAGFVVATPQGNGPLPYWNAVPHPDLPDDVRFVADVIADVRDDLCIDADRIYVDGFSNGAFLASLVACELPDTVAAVAAVAGLLFPAGCAPARPVPILAIHGTADRFVTIDASPNVGLDTLQWDEGSTRAFAGLAFAPLTTTAARWADAEGCTEPPVDGEAPAGVTRLRYEGCDGGSVVEVDIVDGAGHTWPGSAFARASAGVLGPATDAFDADERIWAFFLAHPMPR